MPFREKKQFLKRSIYLLTILLLLIFIASALFSDSGILVNMRVKTEYERLLAERNDLRKENAHLTSEIKALKNNDREIEALGRKVFGFGRPGEVIFFFPNDASAPIERYQMNEPAAPL